MRQKSDVSLTQIKKIFYVNMHTQVAVKIREISGFIVDCTLLTLVTLCQFLSNFLKTTCQILS